MNNTQKISPKEIFSFGLKNAKKYFWQFLAFMVVYGIFNALIPTVDEGEVMSAAQGIGFFVGLIATYYLSMCLYSVTIKLGRGYTVSLKDFFIWPKNGFKSIWTSIVQLLVFVPFILLMGLSAFLIGLGTGVSSVILTVIGSILIIVTIIFFIFVVVRLYFSAFYSLETGEWAFPSIKQSWTATKGRVWFLIWLGIISMGIILLGILAIVVGLLWAVPTVIIALGYTYTKFFPIHNNNAEIIAQPTEITEHTVTTESVVETNNTNTQI
jgi:hypothetical protein